MNIIASSSALIASWLFLDDFGVCFDAGDGLCAGLGLKSRKIKHLFVSHADRDHLAGLLQFNALNGSAAPVIYYPADCGSFPALRDFFAKFDQHTGQSCWRPIRADDEIEVGKGLYVRALTSNHVQIGGLQKSLSFVLFRRQRKLRPEFAGKDIVELRKSLPEETLFENREQRLFGYSGDGTPQPALWPGVEILAHEATFITPDDVSEARARHSGLADTLAMMAELQPAAGILYHFSPRYSGPEIEAAVEKQREALGLKFPLHLVVPGGVTRISL